MGSPNRCSCARRRDLCQSREASGAPIRGLRGEYFSNASLSGSPVVIATNATLDFDWSTGAPGFGVSTDSFSVRWTGMLRAPASGVHTFQTIRYGRGVQEPLAAWMA